MSGSGYSPLPTNIQDSRMEREEMRKSLVVSRASGTCRRYGALLVLMFALTSFGILHAYSTNLEKLNEQWEAEFARMGTLNVTPVDVFPLPPVWDAPDSEYLAICSSIRDQAWDLPEWLRHHYYHLGIKKFYIFDDGSIPPLADQLSPEELGVPHSAVTFIYYDAAHRQQPQQTTVFNECVRMFGHLHEWLALIDGDEFFEMIDPQESIQGFLRNQREDTGALGAQWLIHNSANVTSRPPRGECRRTFTKCIIDPPEADLDNGHFKSVVRTQAFVRMLSPHHVELQRGWRAVSDDGVDIPADPGYLVVPPKRNKLILHHYLLKSLEEYQEKMERGSGMDNKKKLDFWERVEAIPEVDCSSLAQYTP